MTDFFNYSELTQLHIELTNACNAACPMCTRFHGNSPLVRSDLVVEQITLEQFKTWFPPEVIRKLEIILFCGVHGDPGMAKDLYEICEYIAISNPNIAVRMNTNGGMRKPEFWEKLGKLCASMRQDHWRWIVTFSIDGLADTNHIYRRNVEWDNLIANVKAFINAGGSADWDYLIFKHNEHQVDEAKALAKQLKFREFYPKKSLGVDNGSQLVRMPALTREGKLDYWIDAPVDPKNRNLETPINTQVIEKHYPFTIEQYQADKDAKRVTNPTFWRKVDSVYSIINSTDTTAIDNTSIKCKARTMTGGIEIFVDNHGRVIPCCYMGTYLNGVYSDIQGLQLHHEFNKYGWDKLSLHNHSLKEIMEQHHLDRLVTDTWTKPTCSDGKLAYCANTCGTFSAVDKIYTHDKMDDKGRNWRLFKKDNG